MIKHPFVYNLDNVITSLILPEPSLPGTSSTTVSLPPSLPLPPPRSCHFSPSYVNCSLTHLPQLFSEVHEHADKLIQYWGRYIARVRLPFYFTVCPIVFFLYIYIYIFFYILILPLFFLYFLLLSSLMFFFFILFISGEPWTHLDTILLNTTSRRDPSSAVRHTSFSFGLLPSLSPSDGLNKLEPKYRIILWKRV